MATSSFNFVDPAFASCDPIRQTDDAQKDRGHSGKTCWARCPQCGPYRRGVP
jgi:hypothetical protein